MFLDVWSYFGDFRFVRWDLWRIVGVIFAGFVEGFNHVFHAVLDVFLEDFRLVLVFLFDIIFLGIFFLGGIFFR